MDDPQTGHHNLNLPVSLDDIQRIEILKGPGSSIYGANAFSGVINIITKKGKDKTLSLQTSGGQNGYYDGSVYGALPIGIINNHISLSKQKSDGFIQNTSCLKPMICHLYPLKLPVRNIIVRIPAVL